MSGVSPGQKGQRISMEKKTTSKQDNFAPSYTCQLLENIQKKYYPVNASSF